MRKIYFIIILLFFQNTISYSQYSDIKLRVSFEEDFENTIYPSLILGLSSYTAKSKDELNLFKYELISKTKELNVKVELLKSKINNTTTFIEPIDSGKNIFYPHISWDYDNLKILKQSGSVDLSFKLFANEKELKNEYLRMNYRSVNECVYGFIDNNGSYYDLKWMFAAYINEEHPLIDKFLQEVLNLGIVNSFYGYQGRTEASVLEQVFAIWYTLQTKGVKYSSITETSNPSKKVFSQHVRFFDEVYNNTQANCVDGSVFLCSILQKIGIKTFMVLVPGHMYMGFYTRQDKSSYKILETTMVGAVSLSEIYQLNQSVYNLNKYLKYLSQSTYNNFYNGFVSLSQVKQEISRNSFYESLNYNINNWNSYLPSINNIDNYLYQMLDIEELRQLVQPIGR